MDIERINENTLKLFITYRDIEDRGYSREEIWYNRQKGEELFWDVIGEVNTDEYFDLEGPIWIHINASEQGLEVIVTRASVQNEPEEMFDSLDEQQEVASQLREMENAIFDTFDNEGTSETTNLIDARFVFKDIDELVPLAKRLSNYDLSTQLYEFEGKYYLQIDFSAIEDIKRRKNALFIIKEYLQPSRLTVYRLQEYGKCIMASNVFDTVLQYFD
jgi:adapter protein MecA 1/2